MSLITALLVLYILAKPFYFWASGLPQISDLILVLAFVFVFLTYRPKEVGRIINENIHYFLFLVLVFVINLIYSIQYVDFSFCLKTIYYIFDFLGIIVFSMVFAKDKNAFRFIRVSFVLSLIIQLCIFVAGFGRYYDDTRYMGTFNDPNQFAYYCLLSYSFIFLLSKKEKKQGLVNFVFLVLTLFLIFQSSSTGMLLGAGIFLAFYAISLIRNFINNFRLYFPRLLISSVIIIILFGVMAVTPIGDTVLNKIANSSIISRVKSKTERATGNADMSLWEERGYDRMIYYPHYLIFGAGEGRYERFEKSYINNEFHATLPNILFSYGIVPLILICVWIKKKVWGVDFEYFCVYAALLLESFTLINSRQVLFWVIFLLPVAIKDSRKRIHEV